jgi:hypothetical protein
MMLSWGFLLPLGVVCAHFLRHRENALWFKLHRIIQSLGLVLAIAGFSVALANFHVFDAGASVRSTAHGSMGVLVMLLGVLQPVNAFFRPHHEEPGRRKWELLHKGSGYTAVVLGGLTCAVGASIAGPTFLGGYAVVLFTVVLLAVLARRDKKVASLIDGKEDAEL